MSKTGKKWVAMAVVGMLAIGAVGCGGSTTASKGFSPKYASDTEYKLSVVGTYSNFESLESAIERFYEHYP